MLSLQHLAKTNAPNSVVALSNFLPSSLIVRSFSKLVVLPLEGPDILQTIFLYISIYISTYISLYISEQQCFVCFISYFHVCIF